MNKVLIILILFNTLICQSKPPTLFNYNQGTFQGFYFFKDVMIDSIKIAQDDWVGTFNCTEWNDDSTACEKLGPCVGTREWTTANCGGGVCDLPAMGTGGESSETTAGYMEEGEFPTFLIYDNSIGVYYTTEASGDVRLQQDICRNGYPFCYTWKNFGFVFAERLIGKEIYMDCSGKFGGENIIDECGVCGGSGPQYPCNRDSNIYCTEYEFQQKCTDPDTVTE